MATEHKVRAIIGNYGELEGLPVRIACWCERLTSPALPWVGLGLIKDLRMVMRLLTLREFGEFLKVHADAPGSEWADAILKAADDADGLEQLQEDIEQALPVRDGEEYAVVVAEAGRKAEQYDHVRAVLVETGALAADDESLALPDLLRVLLS